MTVTASSAPARTPSSCFPAKSISGTEPFAFAFTKLRTKSAGARLREPCRSVGAWERRSAPTLHAPTLHASRPLISAAYGKVEGRTLVHRGFGPDTAAMLAHDAVHRSQAHAGPLKLFSPVQPLEDAKQFASVFHAEPDTVIADKHGHLAVHLGVADFDDDGGARAGVFDSVGEEVGQDLPHQARITFEGGERVYAPFDGATFSFALEVGEHFLDHCAQGSGLALQFLPAYPGQVEQIIHQPAHVAAAIEDVVQVNLRFVRQRGGELLVQNAGECINVTQGGAQVVGDRIGEGLQFLVGGGQLGGAILDALLQFGVHAEDLLFSPLAFGDVIADFEDGGGLAMRVVVQDPLAGHEPSLAVFARVDQLTFPMALAEQRGADELQRLAKFGAEELVRGFAQGFRPGPPIHFFHAAVPKNDAIIQIASQDVGQIEHLGLFTQNRRLLFQRGVGPLAFGDVAGDGGEANDFVVRILDRRDRERHFDGVAILVHADRLEAADAALFDILQDAGLLLWSIRREQRCDWAAQHLGGSVAEHALGAGIPTDDNTLKVLPDDGVIGGLDDGGQERPNLLSHLAFGDVCSHSVHAHRLAAVVVERFAARDQVMD